MEKGTEGQHWEHSVNMLEDGGFIDSTVYSDCISLGKNIEDIAYAVPQGLDSIFQAIRAEHRLSQNSGLGVDLQSFTVIDDHNVQANVHITERETATVLANQDNLGRYAQFRRYNGDYWYILGPNLEDSGNLCGLLQAKPPPTPIPTATAIPIMT